MNITEVIALARAGYKKADIDALREEEKAEEAKKAEAEAEEKAKSDAEPQAESVEKVEPPKKQPEEEEEKTDYKALYEKAIEENRRLNLEPINKEAEKTLAEIFREAIY